MAARWAFPAERGARQDQAEETAVERRRAEEIIEVLM
jgi:hypothetical protein